MREIQIPGVEFPVSQYCLGCAFLGAKQSEEESFALMDYYYEQGGRFLKVSVFQPHCIMVPMLLLQLMRAVIIRFTI